MNYYPALDELWGPDGLGLSDSGRAMSQVLKLLQVGLYGAEWCEFHREPYVILLPGMTGEGCCREWALGFRSDTEQLCSNYILLYAPSLIGHTRELLDSTGLVVAPDLYSVIRILSGEVNYGRLPEAEVIEMLYGRVLRDCQAVAHDIDRIDRSVGEDSDLDLLKQRAVACVSISRELLQRPVDQKNRDALMPRINTIEKFLNRYLE